MIGQKYWTKRVRLTLAPCTLYTVKIEASYTLEGTVLENVDSIRYLGETITNDLKCNTHITNFCTKVQVGKDQEKAQSEKDSHSKNRGGKKPN